jgi:hypothetical protein
MRKLAILTTTLALVLAAAVPAALAQDKQDKGKDSRGSLGGVLDTLGNVLGTGPQKLHGTVVLADGSTFVLRTDDGRTYRVDTASLDQQKISAVTPGQTVSVTARGGGQAGVLTASDLTADAKSTGSDAKSNGKTFQTVNGTVQQASRDRVMFRTRDGLVLPVDVGNINGLPYLAANQPATLYYEQGPKQEIVGVWIQPGSGQAAQPSPTTSQTPPQTPPTPSGQTSPSASVPSTQSVDGVVESIAMFELKIRTSDGRPLTVDTSGVDRQALRGVAPGDGVTVTGAADTSGDRFVAQSVQPRR